MISTDELVANIDRAEAGELEPEPELVQAPEPKEPPFDFDKEFWLSKPHYSEEFAAEVLKRFEHHRDEWDSSQLGQTIWLAYRAYHNLGSSSDDPLTQLIATGEQGELLALALPHYRSLVKNQIQLFTRERPAWDPQARTSGADDAKQVPMASNLLDYIASLGVLDRRIAEQVEMMMCSGAGFHVTGWDPNAGYGGRGWFTQAVYAPWEITHERVRRYEDATWWIAIDYIPRWEWVKHFAKSDPEKARTIASYDWTNERVASSFLNRESDSPDEFGDRVPALILMAKPTRACPNGRYALVLGDGKTVLQDGLYPFGEEVTVSRMCASEFLGTATPYSDTWGVLAAAEAFNAIISMILTRVDTCGVPNFAVPKGSELTYSDIAGGNQVWELGPGVGRPEVIDMLRVPPELPAVLELLSGEMEKIVGINSVTRGQPQENVSSGSMAALLQSMAIEFNNNLERAWILNLERIGTHHLRVFQQMASQPQAISICGEDNQWVTQEFTKESVSGVLRVAVQTANALSKTTAGRVAIADKLADLKFITTAGEYMRVVQTGTNEPTFRGPVGQLTGIKARMERLSRGENSPPMLWDNHQLCIREMQSLLDSDLRNDVETAKHVFQTLKAQKELWAQISREDPDLLAAIGCPPLPVAFQLGASMRQMMTGGMGMTEQTPPPPAQTKQPETEEAKSTPGPKPSPPGAEPSQGHPKEPQPAKPANNPMTGEAVAAPPV